MFIFCRKFEGKVSRISFYHFYIYINFSKNGKSSKKRQRHLQEYTMKMCFLTLVFRNLGTVKVLQSARYFRSNNQNEVIKQAYIDANYFVANGFDVLRKHLSFRILFRIERATYAPLTIEGIMPLKIPVESPSINMFSLFTTDNSSSISLLLKSHILSLPYFWKTAQNRLNFLFLRLNWTRNLWILQVRSQISLGALEFRYICIKSPPIHTHAKCFIFNHRIFSWTNPFRINEIFLLIIFDIKLLIFSRRLYFFNLIKSFNHKVGKLFIIKIKKNLRNWKYASFEIL